ALPERVVRVVEIDLLVVGARGVDISHRLPEARAAVHRPANAETFGDGDIRAVEVGVEIRILVPEIAGRPSERRRAVVDGHLPAAVRFGDLERNVALERNGDVLHADVP